VAGPQGLYSVSVMPSFLLDGARAGWQGACFTDTLGADEGIVAHGHERYCLQRGMHREARRTLGRRGWHEMPVGLSVWRSGDEQRFHWRGGGRSQFLFIEPGQAAVLGHDRALPPVGHDAPARLPVPELIFDALQADVAQGSPEGPLVGDSRLKTVMACVGLGFGESHRRDGRLPAQT